MRANRRCQAPVVDTLDEHLRPWPSISSGRSKDKKQKGRKAGRFY
jgi:hypothetical protein